MSYSVIQGSPVQAIDLFCGAGGLTHGLINAGIDVRLGVDFEQKCQYPYTANNGTDFLLKSVEDLTADELATYYDKAHIRLLAGCAPCQTFSMANHHIKESDPRFNLLGEFSRLVVESPPDLVAMENVPPIARHEVFADFVATLKANGYYVTHNVVNCAEYGLPQSRRRLVLLASRLGPVSLLTPEQFGSEPKTVRDAIGSLPPIEAGTTHPNDPLHKSQALSELSMLRIKASVPGGTWCDWPRELVADCHKKSSGKTYASVYSRMTWDGPAPTLTTQFFGFGNGRFGHPEQDRAISLREGALLQGFPPEYEFMAPGKPAPFEPVGRLIGNAVPPLLGELIGASLLNSLVP